MAFAMRKMRFGINVAIAEFILRFWVLHRRHDLKRFAALLLLLIPFLGFGQGIPPPFDPLGRPNRNRSGPWDNDVLVYRVGQEGRVAQLATFERAGVPTVARLGHGRLIAAHQHFPADNEADFDKVAVRFSSDEGSRWTPPQVIQLVGLPQGMRFPFDPTLVPLPDGRVRLYFTSLKGRRFEESVPAIYSAVSSNGVNYTFEPGVRFGIAGRLVIDCAVVLYQGVFHLYAPDNGAGRPPGQPAARPREGIGYHATSRDGLNFTRADDLEIEGRRRWLGNALVQTADGKWERRHLNLPGADPNVCRLADGWYRAYTKERDGAILVFESSDALHWARAVEAFRDERYPHATDPDVFQTKDSWVMLISLGPRLLR
jgi:hypothetical protein